METTHHPLNQTPQTQLLDRWRESLEQILAVYAGIPYRYGDVSTYVVVSRDRNHYMLVHDQRLPSVRP